MSQGLLSAAAPLVPIRPDGGTREQYANPTHPDGQTVVLAATVSERQLQHVCAWLLWAPVDSGHPWTLRARVRRERGYTA